MAPEDNPADDVQPTKEEWEAYQRDKAKVVRGPFSRPLPDIAQSASEASAAVAGVCAKAGTALDTLNAILLDVKVVSSGIAKWWPTIQATAEAKFKAEESQ